MSLGGANAGFVRRSSCGSIPCKNTEYSSRCFAAFVRGFVCSLQMQGSLSWVRQFSLYQYG